MSLKGKTLKDTTMRCCEGGGPKEVRKRKDQEDLEKVEKAEDEEEEKEEDEDEEREVRRTKVVHESGALKVDVLPCRAVPVIGYG